MPVSPYDGSVGTNKDVSPYWQSPTDNVRIWQGDVRHVLPYIQTESVQCVVTSPPYWGLRDYKTGTWEGGDSECDHRKGYVVRKDSRSTLGGTTTTQNHSQELFLDRNGNCARCGAKRTDQQIGSEPIPDCMTWGKAQCGRCYVCVMVDVFKQVWRILRDDGILWLNLGDTYGADNNRNGMSDYGSTLGGRNRKPNNPMVNHGSTGLSPGNLVGIPWRVALALQADGWILRQDNIWAKTNPMPESCQNRCTKSHEYLFQFVKQEDYFCDMVAIKETSLDPESHKGRNKRNDDKFARNGGKFAATRMGFSKIPEGKTYPTANKRDVWSVDDEQALLQWITRNHPDQLVEFLEQRENKLDVWNVATHPYPGAHYATFPPKLIEPCILAGTGEKGCCTNCGKCWIRIVRSTGVKGVDNEVIHTEKSHGNPGARGDDRVRRLSGATYKHTKKATDLWKPQCSCSNCGKCGKPWSHACGCSVEFKRPETRPCVVFDPFLGSGTTAEVSLLHGRHCWGIELSEKYLKMNAIPCILSALLRINARR
jgi:DNA modification methylase